MSSTISISSYAWRVNVSHSEAQSLLSTALTPQLKMRLITMLTPAGVNFQSFFGNAGIIISHEDSGEN